MFPFPRSSQGVLCNILVRTSPSHPGRTRQQGKTRQEDRTGQSVKSVDNVKSVRSFSNVNNRSSIDSSKNVNGDGSVNDENGVNAIDPAVGVHVVDPAGTVDTTCMDILDSWDNADTIDTSARERFRYC